MRLHIHVVGLLALAVSSGACGSETKEAESPAKVTATKTPAEEPKPAPTMTPTAEPVPKLTMAEMQKKSITGMLAAFNAHDAKKLAAFYAPDSTARMPSREGWKEDAGREAIEKSHTTLFNNVPDAKTGTVRVQQKGDVAIWEWIGTGTDSVGMDGDKPTNKQVGFAGASVLTFDENGLVKTDHTYFDSATIAGQLGKLPKDQKVRPVMSLPAGDGVWIESKNTGAEATNVDLLKEIYTAIEKGDDKAFLSMIDDKGTHSDLTMPNDVVGKDAAKKELAGMKKTFGDMKFNVEQAWGVGDNVIAEVSATATNKGPIGSMKPTHKKVTMHGLDIAEMSNGKCMKMTSYGNSAELVAQIAPPKKEAAPKEMGTDPKKDVPKKK